MTMSPSLIVDIVLAIVCLFVIIKYTAKGFLKTVLDIARLGLSVLLAIMFRGVVARLLNDLFMSNTVYNWVYGSVSKYIEGIDGKINFVSIYENNPEFYSKVLSAFGLDFYLLEEQMNNLSAETAANVSRTISDPLANMFSVLLAVLVIFIVSMVILYFVAKGINKITKIKGINIINRILGVALGVILAVIIVWGISIILQVMVNAIGPMVPDVFNESLIENSMIISLLRELGLLNILEGFTSQITGSV